MQEITNNEVQKGGTALGMVAVFLAGVGLATTVAILAARTHGDRMSKQTDHVLDACDRAIQKLESRMKAVDIALAG